MQNQQLNQNRKYKIYRYIIGALVYNGLHENIQEIYKPFLIKVSPCLNSPPHTQYTSISNCMMLNQILSFTIIKRIKYPVFSVSDLKKLLHV